MAASNHQSAESDLSIYRLNPNRESFIEKSDLHKKDLCHQKIWVIWHVFLFIFIASKTLYLLGNKNIILQNFYNSHEQCCYCAWIARNGTFNEHKEIEYSQCYKSYNQPYNEQGICTNATNYEYID